MKRIEAAENSLRIVLGKDEVLTSPNITVIFTVSYFTFSSFSYILMVQCGKGLKPKPHLKEVQG